MHLRNHSMMVAIGATLLLGLCGSDARAAWASGSWVNGWWVYPYKNFTNNSVTRRPGSSFDKGLALSDWRISKLPINNKGMNITVTKLADGKSWAYRWIAVWHCEISDVWRTPGYHTDFIRIAGGGNVQDVPTTVLLQDIYLHDGEGIPLLIQDGIFDKITLKDIRVARTTVCLQLVTMNSGRIGTITVDNCPNMSIAIMGRPGSIGTCYVKNSPGLRISDVANSTGKSGCRIIYVD